MEDVRSKWRWARIFMWACGSVVAYFSSGYFMTHDAGLGAALVSLGVIYFFYRWNRNIETMEAVDEFIETCRSNNRSNWRR